MSEKKSAYKMTTPEQAPLFMCAGKDNKGKVPKVDKNGFITEFVAIGSGSTEYTAGTGIIVDNDLHVISLDPNTLNNTTLTGTTSIENIIVDGDVVLGSTGSTITMDEASSIVLGDNATCSDPTTALGVANKQYADTKVAKTTNANKVYGNDGTGAQTEFSINVDNQAYTIAYRGENSTLNVGTPTSDTHAATKKYVDDLISGGGAAGIISKTWSELKALRDTAKLEVGKYYRITDYVATTTQENTQSANHPFDLVLFSIANNKFSENCYAAHHSGDTYFTNCDLSVWDVWYCLDNDTDRFTWADATNGKGVIYYLKDEFNNSAWYDWKGIQVKNTNTTDRFYYLFDNSGVDASMSSSTSFPRVYANKLGMYIKSSKYKIGCNIFKAESVINNTIGNYCYDNTIGDSFLYNTIGNEFYNNTIGNEFYNNTIGNGFYGNRIGNDFSYNTIGSNFQFNYIGNSFGSNTIGNLFSSNYLTAFSEQPGNCSFPSGVTNKISASTTFSRIKRTTFYLGSDGSLKTLD